MSDSTRVIKPAAEELPTDVLDLIRVVAELPGSNPALPPIVIACHLDSWDLGTGAIDDAAGCGIITAAASASAAPPPIFR